MLKGKQYRPVANLDASFARYALKPNTGMMFPPVIPDDIGDKYNFSSYFGQVNVRGAQFFIWVYDRVSSNGTPYLAVNIGEMSKWGKIILPGSYDTYKRIAHIRSMKDIDMLSKTEIEELEKLLGRS